MGSDIVPRILIRTAACTCVLCPLAFESFWNRINTAGMLLVLLALGLVGLGFGHMLNTPCPTRSAPDVAPPPQQPDALPQQPDVPPLRAGLLAQADALPQSGSGGLMPLDFIPGAPDALQEPSEP